MPSPAPLDLLYRPEAIRDLDDLFDHRRRQTPRRRTVPAGDQAGLRRLRWFPFIGHQLDPDDERIRGLTVRRRAGIKFLVAEGAVHILAVSYRGRGLSSFFASRAP